MFDGLCISFKDVNIFMKLYFSIKQFGNVLVGVITPSVANPTREYYTFAGWNPTNKDVVVNGNANYCATWKANNDTNNDGVADDLCVAPGTDILRVGAGVEYFPLMENRNLRLHLNCCYTDGDSPITNALQPKQTIIDAGLTWKMNFLNLKRR